MNFDLEAWWERNGKAMQNADIYTSECEVYDFCSGLVGDVLTHCEREHLAAMKDVAEAHENLIERAINGL